MTVFNWVIVKLMLVLVEWFLGLMYSGYANSLKSKDHTVYFMTKSHLFKEVHLCFIDYASVFCTLSFKPLPTYQFGFKRHIPFLLMIRLKFLIKLLGIIKLIFTPDVFTCHWCILLFCLFVLSFPSSQLVMADFCTLISLILLEVSPCYKGALLFHFYQTFASQEISFLAFLSNIVGSLL